MILPIIYSTELFFGLFSKGGGRGKPPSQKNEIPTVILKKLIFREGGAFHPDWVWFKLSGLQKVSVVAAFSTYSTGHRGSTSHSLASALKRGLISPWPFLISMMTIFRGENASF